MADALVVGGGVIGLAAAYRLAGAGHRGPAGRRRHRRGASWAAAGMLAPVSEAGFGEDALTRLSLAAVPAFRRSPPSWTSRTGEPVGLRTEGTLVVGVQRRRPGRAGSADRLSRPAWACAPSG